MASLQAAGYHVTLVAPPLQEVQARIGASPVQQRVRRLYRLWRLFRHARRLGADLYHFHDPDLIPVAYGLKRLTGARIVYDMHEDYGARRGVEGQVLRALEQWSMRWVDHVVLAEACYEALLPDHVPRTQVLNYAETPTDPVPPNSLDRHPFRLLYAGVQGRRRGLGMLLDLACLIRDQRLPWHLTLAGVCYVAEDRAWARRRVEEEGLAGIVELAGWDAYLPWPELEPFFREAHVGLCFREATLNYERRTPTKFYEYLTYGLPIVCSRFPRWQAFVEEHGCGATVANEDPEGLLRVLQAWAGEPLAYARLSRAAAAAAPAYQWACMEPRLLALYDELLGRTFP